MDFVVLNSEYQDVTYVMSEGKVGQNLISGNMFVDVQNTPMESGIITAESNVPAITVEAVVDNMNFLKEYLVNKIDNFLNTWSGWGKRDLMKELRDLICSGSDNPTINEIESYVLAKTEKYIDMGHWSQKGKWIPRTDSDNKSLEATKQKMVERGILSRGKQTVFCGDETPKATKQEIADEEYYRKTLNRHISEASAAKTLEMEAKASVDNMNDKYAIHPKEICFDRPNAKHDGPYVLMGIGIDARHDKWVRLDDNCNSKKFYAGCWSKQRIFDFIDAKNDLISSGTPNPTLTQITQRAETTLWAKKTANLREKPERTSPKKLPKGLI